MSDLTTTAIRLSGGRTPTWDVTVTREDGETRTYRVMNESEDAAKVEALAMWDFDHGIEAVSARGWFIGDVRRADGNEPKLSDLAEDIEVWDGKKWRNLDGAMREEFIVQLNLSGVEP